jgi:hypothetical protein
MAPPSKIPCTPTHQTYHPDDDPDDSTPVGRTMSAPRIVKPRRAAGALQKKLATGFASLYDDDDEPAIKPSLKSPIHTYGPVIPPVVELARPRAVGEDSNTSSEEETDDSDTTDSEDADSGDPMDIDELEAPKDLQLAADSKVRSEWVGTSQFFIEENVEWQNTVSG